MSTNNKVKQIDFYYKISIRQLFVGFHFLYTIHTLTYTSRKLSVFVGVISQDLESGEAQLLQVILLFVISFSARNHKTIERAQRLLCSMYGHVFQWILVFIVCAAI